MEAEFLQLSHDPPVAPEEIFGSDADDDVAQLLRQARPPDSLEGTSAADRWLLPRCGDPACVRVGGGQGRRGQRVRHAWVRRMTRREAAACRIRAVALV
jgi:hypothetical protein